MLSFACYISQYRNHHLPILVSWIGMVFGCRDCCLCWGRQVSELRVSPGWMTSTHFSSALFIFIAVELVILRRCSTLALSVMLPPLRDLRWEKVIWALGTGSRWKLATARPCVRIAVILVAREGQSGTVWCLERGLSHGVPRALSASVPSRAASSAWVPWSSVAEPPGRVCASWHGEGLPHPPVIHQCLFYFAGMRADLGTVPKSIQVLQISCVPSVMHTSPCTRLARSMVSALHMQSSWHMQCMWSFMPWEALREKRWVCGEEDTDKREGGRLPRDLSTVQGFSPVT